MASSKEAGVSASNQDFSKYDQVKKNQLYGLSENDHYDQFDDEYEIPVCDMSAYFSGGDKGKAEFAAQLGDALSGIGFAILTGHGVDTSLYDEAQQKVAEFFETIPMEEKKRFLAQRQGSVNQGYFPIKETTNIHPDLVEGWVFCRRAFDLDGKENYDPKDFWPDSSYEVFFRQIVQAHEGLIIPIMQSILRHLGCDPHFYDSKLTKTNFGFRLNYYPALSGADDDGGRMLGHEDVDFFTILPAEEMGGLQVLNRRNMKWIRLNAPKGSIILNTGDYMQRITNDLLPSTTHRVAKPTDEANMGKPRVSIPMAVYVWEHETLEVLPCCGKPKYPPVNAEVFHTSITSKYYGDDYAKNK